MGIWDDIKGAAGSANEWLFGGDPSVNPAGTMTPEQIAAQQQFMDQGVAAGEGLAGLAGQQYTGQAYGDFGNVLAGQTAQGPAFQREAFQGADISSVYDPTFQEQLAGVRGAERTAMSAESLEMERDIRADQGGELFSGQTSRRIGDERRRLQTDLARQKRSDTQWGLNAQMQAAEAARGRGMGLAGMQNQFNLSQGMQGNQMAQQSFLANQQAMLQGNMFGEQQRFGAYANQQQNEMNFRGQNINAYSNLYGGGINALGMNQFENIVTPNEGAFGSIAQAGMAGAMIFRSDKRLKNETGKVKTGLDTVNAMEGKKWTWKEETGVDTNQEHEGFMAQEIERLIPNAVQEINGVKHVDIYALIPTMVNAIKELSDKVAVLEG